MEDYLTILTDYLLTQSWQIAILVVVVAAISWLLRNKSAHVRYLLWLIVLAKCITPPMLDVPIAVLPEKVPAPAVMPTPLPTINEAPPEIQRPIEPISVAAPLVHSQTQLSARQWLAIAWMVCAAAFACIAAVKARRTMRWLQHDRRPLPADVQIVVNDLLSSLNLRRRPKMWLLEGIGQPFVWGALRGDIYLPATFVLIQDDEYRRHVLGHEISHVMRFDAAINLLQVIAQAIFWFHPFVWWANKRIRAEREKCCDEMAIARLNAKVTDYSRAIVETLVTEYESIRPVPSLAVAGPAKNIEERIRTMLRPGKKFHERPSLRAIAVLLMVSLLTIPANWGLTRRARAETASEPQEKPSKSLHEAAQDGDNHQIRLLLAQGADVNTKVGNGKTPLHVAVENGKIETANLLIQKGADVNAKNSAGITPLHNAALMGDIKMANLLITKGADVNAKNQSGLTPVSRALLSDGGGRLMVELLVSKGAKVSELHLAAHRGDIDDVRSSLSKGTKVDVRDKAGHTPLFYAASAGQMHVVDFLISEGADVNAKDNRGGETPLFYAGDAGWKNVVELLVDKGADINARGAGRSTALTSAIWLGRIDVAELLITKGADVNARDDWGYIPLHPAARNGLVEIVKMLISKDSDVNAKTGWGETPLHSATLGEPLPGVTPLYSATLDGKIRVVQILIANGADVNTKDKKFGQTPLQLAQNNGYTEIVELLRKHGAK